VAEEAAKNNESTSSNINDRISQVNLEYLQ